MPELHIGAELVPGSTPRENNYKRVSHGDLSSMPNLALE